MKPAIQVEKLTKRFRLGAAQGQGYRTLRESLFNRFRRSTSHGRCSTRESFWALNDVSFAIQPGEVVGLIGRNGAGKSTALKILSRISEPTSGRAVVRGRVGSLLEVGTGFHNELTGRENIFLNGSILGMSRREITRKFDEIVAFSEIERFLDTPVKRYSSGMYVRLAFAVAAHLDLEVLLVDEVLAVGDQDFQKKCLAKMGTIAEGGRTVIFVSHNLGLIHRLCNRAIMLRQGQIHRDGPAAQVIEAYLRENQAHDGRWDRPEHLQSTKDVVIHSARVISPDGCVAGIVNCDDGLRLVIDYEVIRSTPAFEVGFTLRNSEGIAVVSSLDSDSASLPGRIRLAGRYRSECQVPGNLLAPGSYFMTLAAHVANQATFEIFPDALAFEVATTGCIRNKRNDSRPGLITPIFDWRIEQRSGLSCSSD